MAADWANLPQELLAIIALNLVFIEDLVVFSAVCKSWFSIVYTVIRKLPPLPSRSPWLMLSDHKTTVTFDNVIYYDSAKVCSFFSLSTKILYEIELPEALGRKCFGVSYGWILTLGYDLQISLFHPFSRNQITLPPLLSFPDQYQYDDINTPWSMISVFIRKVILLSNPLKDENFQVMAIYGPEGKLAFARAKDKKWTDVQVSSYGYCDLVYHKGSVYAINYYGVLVHQGPTPKAIIPPLDERPIRNADMYLVESSGELLLVIRVYGGYNYINGLVKYFNKTEFDIYWCDLEMLKEAGQKGKFRNYTILFIVLKMERCHECGLHANWVRVQSLGDKALFLGNNSSKSLSVSETHGGLKANCIYFTEHSRQQNNRGAPEGGGRDMGIFDMEDNTIKPFCLETFVSHVFPPMWVI